MTKASDDGCEGLYTGNYRILVNVSLDSLYFYGNTDTMKIQTNSSVELPELIHCGDVNNDGVINLIDINDLNNFINTGSPEPIPSICVGDVNGDGVINASDVQYLINYYFYGGPPPVSTCCDTTTDTCPPMYLSLQQEDLPVLNLYPWAGSTGETIFISGNSFTPHANVTIEFNGNNMAMAQTDNAGNFTSSFTVPVVPHGYYTVRAFDYLGKHHLRVFYAQPTLFMKTSSAMVNPGEIKKTIAITGQWTETIGAYSCVMHFDPTMITLDHATFNGTVGSSASLAHWYHPQPGVITAIVIWLYEYIPAGSGTLLYAVVNISNNATPGQQLALHLGEYPPAATCTYVKPDSTLLPPLLIDGALIVSSIKCGDATGNGVIDVGDVVYLINYLFKGGPTPLPLRCAGDCNGDSIVDVGDVVYLVNYLFKNGPAPQGCC